MRKSVTLFDFFKRLTDSGLNMVGCQIRDSTTGLGNYEFLALKDGSVQVKYGHNQHLTGHMSKGLKVEEISMTTASGKKIAGAGCDNKTIVVTFSERGSRW